MLTGYKTYICAGLGVIVVAANALGYIDSQVEISLLAILGFGSVAGLRAALPAA